MIARELKNTVTMNVPPTSIMSEHPNRSTRVGAVEPTPRPTSSKTAAIARGLKNIAVSTAARNAQLLTLINMGQALHRLQGQASKVDSTKSAK